MDSIHDWEYLEDLRRRSRLDPDLIRQFRNAFYKKQRTVEQALSIVPEPARALWGGRLAFHSLQLESRQDSALDGASKLLFRTDGGLLLETVILRIGSGRTSLCVSSQVGCAARCRFCATGQMDNVAHLGRDKILDQVVQANLLLRAEGRTVRNVVFMGMGEPLHNEAAVYQALEILLSPQGFNLSTGHVLVSTVGVPDAMVRFAQRFPRVGLALSLHSADQAVRERLIPLARRHPLVPLREAMDRVTALQNQPLMIEYLLLEGINDADEDATALIDFLRGLPVHINLIPYNANTLTPEWTGTSPERRRAFAGLLSTAGYPVTMRYSLGADITAACGQLALEGHGGLPENKNPHRIVVIDRPLSEPEA